MFLSAMSKESLKNSLLFTVVSVAVWLLFTAVGDLDEALVFTFVGIFSANIILSFIFKTKMQTAHIYPLELKNKKARLFSLLVAVVLFYIYIWYFALGQIFQIIK